MSANQIGPASISRAYGFVDPPIWVTILVLARYSYGNSMSSTIFPDKFLLEEDDGLPLWPSNQYVHYKLKALATYIQITNTSMKDKPWRARYYIDLQAGPGKNQIKHTGSIVLGSPLIALNSKPSFTDYRFNEIDPVRRNALEQRVKASPLHKRARIFQEDVNQVVEEICAEIDARDRVYQRGRWPCLNIAFLDPEGLEIEWGTIERLANVNRMDLIINFSTMGLMRISGTHEFDAGDRFFGTVEWRKVYETWDKPSVKRRKLIDFYLSRLRQFGYYVNRNPQLPDIDLPVRNSRNSVVYNLIFASKSELGEKFWRQAIKSISPPRLHGFE